MKSESVTPASTDNPASESPVLSGRPAAVSMLLETGVLLLIFHFLNEFIRKRSRIPDEAYGNAIPSLALLTQYKSVLLMIGLSIAFGLGWRKLSWKEIDPPGRLRLFVGILVFTLAWAFSAYDYNFFFGRAHLFERLALLLLAGLSLWRPPFVAFFLMLALLVASQFNVPMDQFSWTDKRVLFDILGLFVSFLLARLFLPDSARRAFVIAAFSLLAANYVGSGISKLQLGWIGRERLSFLFVAAFDNGWLRFLGEEGMSRVASLHDLLNLPFLLATLVIEGGAILALVHRRVAAVFCVLWIALHLAIFASSGILFWKWIVLDAAFIPLAWKENIWWDQPKALRALPAVLSVAIIALAHFVWEPTMLGWYDTPVSGVFRFEAIGQSGATQEITPADFAPYDFPMAQGRFDYILETEPIVSTYSSIHESDRLDALVTLRTTGEATAWKLANATARKVSQKRAARFDRFISEFFRSMNQRKGRRLWFNVLASPQHIWTGPVGGKPFRWKEPITRVRVRYVETLFDGRGRHVFSDQLIREIGIPGD